jgi:hypothetical protein
MCMPKRVRMSLYYAYALLVVMTGLAVGILWGWLEMSPQARQWMME